MKKYLIVASIGALFVLNQSLANSITGTLHATVMPVSLTDSTITRSFDFPGIIVRGVAGSIILDPFNQMTATGGVGLNNSIGQSAELSLSTEADTQVTLSFPSSVELNYTDTTLTPLTLTDINCAYRYNASSEFNSITSNTFQSSPTGTTNLQCGATLNIPANAVAGDVNGTVVIGIAY